VAATKRQRMRPLGANLGTTGANDFPIRTSTDRRIAIIPARGTNPDDAERRTGI
jgi:hypothetical protein